MELNTCRICLKISNSFEACDEIIQANLNSLLLYPDFSITDRPVMCGPCAENLKHCLDFKAKCALSVCYEIFERDLQELYKSGDEKLCSFCLMMVESDAFTILENDVKMLLEYFPELTDNITEESLVCIPCYESLQRHVSFIKRFLQTEKKVQEYCKGVNKNNDGQIDTGGIYGDESCTEIIALSNVAGQYIVNNNEVINESVIEMIHDDDVAFEGAVTVECNSVREEELSQEAFYKCDYCIFITKDCDILDQHILSHKTRPEMITYNRDKVQYKNHKHGTVHDVNKPTKTSCHHCDFKSKTKTDLRRHTFVHKSVSQVMMHKCGVCGFKSKFKSCLNSHMVRHKGMDGVAMYNCNKCGFEAKYKSRLRFHMASHKGRRHQCTKCSFESRFKDVLESHMGTHWGNA